MRTRPLITRVPYDDYTAGRQPGTVDELCYRVWQLLEFYPQDCIRRALDELRPVVLVRSGGHEDIPTLTRTDLRAVEERAGGLDIQGVIPVGVRMADEPASMSWGAGPGQLPESEKILVGVQKQHHQHTLPTNQRQS